MENKSSKVPQFNGANYNSWKGKMKDHIMSLGYEVWESIEEGWTMPATGIGKDVAARQACDNNSKAKAALNQALSESEYSRVIGCKSAKEVWDKLQAIHEGDNVVKEAKL